LLLNAAGPRSFASSSAKRPGLETGDVVALMSEVSCKGFAKSAKSIQLQ